MFRCTDCGKEYGSNPGYCDCGNDSFEEIQEVIADEYDDYGEYSDDNYTDDYNDTEYYDDYNNQNQYQTNYAPMQRSLKKRTRNTSSKKKSMSSSDKVGIGVFSVCLILALVILISTFTGTNQRSSNKSNNQPLLIKNYSIPTDIDSIWDSTPPSGAPNAIKTPDKILNAKINQIDAELKKYLIDLLNDLISNWNRSGIEGNGISQMEFKINPIGGLDSKKLTKLSGNDSLDASVNSLMKDYNSFQAPPSTYKQEYIIVSFSSKNGELKAYYPKVTVK